MRVACTCRRWTHGKLTAKALGVIDEKVRAYLMECATRETLGNLVSQHHLVPPLFLPISQPPAAPPSPPRIEEVEPPDAAVGIAATGDCVSIAPVD